MNIRSKIELMTPDPRIYYWRPDGTLHPGADYDLSVCFQKGVEGPEGWPDGYRWALHCEDGELVNAFDLGGNPFFPITHFLKDLTGYTRQEFLETFFGTNQADLL